MESKSSNSSGGLGLASVLFVVFLVLKLTGTIGWSWWWVTAPLWGSVILFVIVAVAVLVIYMLTQ
jgi:hypothetical protein